MEQIKIQEILELHRKWLKSEDGGVGADLEGANLYGANLYGANLKGADLNNIKNYVDNHDIWIEIIKSMEEIKVKITDEEWGFIGKIYIKRLCWDSIKVLYGDKIVPLFQKLSDYGYGEWLEKYKEV